MMEENKINISQNDAQDDGYQNAVAEVLCKSQDSFEKQLSFLSAGSLGISMLFIEKVVKDVGHAQNKSLLILGWIFLALTLFVNLLSHLVSALCSYRTLKECRDGVKDYRKRGRERTKVITFINWFTLGLLIMGITLIIIFSSINI
jgi:hypothetical protein